TGRAGFAVKQQAGVGSSPGSVVAADFDRDGALDLAVANRGHRTDDGFAGSSVTILRGDGAGGFAVAATLANDIADSDIAAGDLDGDGIPDLVVGDGDVSVFRGRGDWTFREAITWGTLFSWGPIFLRDFDGNGRTD